MVVTLPSSSSPAKFRLWQPEQTGCWLREKQADMKQELWLKADIRRLVLTIYLVT